jgi:hypothetical protein
MASQQHSQGQVFKSTFFMSTTCIGFRKAMRQRVLGFQLGTCRAVLSATAHLELALGLGGLFVVTGF